MSRLAGVTFEVAGGTVAKRWFPALVSGSANTAGGQVVLGKAPNTLVRLAAQQWSREPGPSYPLMGFATSNMSRTKKDLNRFGGALTSEGEPLQELAEVLSLPAPSIVARQSTAGVARDEDGCYAFGVWHMFSRNALARLCLAHDDMAAAQALYEPLGLWNTAGTAPGSSTETYVRHQAFADLPQPLQFGAASAASLVHPGVTLHFEVESVQAAEAAAAAAGVAHVPAPELGNTSFPSGGILLIDPTSYNVHFSERR